MQTGCPPRPQPSFPLQEALSEARGGQPAGRVPPAFRRRCTRPVQRVAKTPGDLLVLLLLALTGREGMTPRPLEGVSGGRGVSGARPHGPVWAGAEVLPVRPHPSGRFGRELIALRAERAALTCAAIPPTFCRKVPSFNEIALSYSQCHKRLPRLQIALSRSLRLQIFSECGVGLPCHTAMAFTLGKEVPMKRLVTLLLSAVIAVFSALLFRPPPRQAPACAWAARRSRFLRCCKTN